MTTAHRPTWNSAVGGSEQGGNRMVVPTRQYSSRDLPGEMTMKARAPVAQADTEEYKAQLQQREDKHFSVQGDGSNLKIKDDKEESYEPSVTKRVKTGSSTINMLADKEDNKHGYVNPFPQDRDDVDLASDSDEKKSESVEKSDDEEDDTEKLFEEYERIKKEREEEQKKKNMEREAEMDKEGELELMRANPLLAGGGYSLTKRWYEDAVFKNQAKTEPKEKKRFINDTVRSDFHKKFLSRYILN